MTLPARLLVLVLGCCLLAAAPASAAFKGRNGELAYEGRASSTGSLLLQAPKQGAKARRLAAPGNPGDPAFSPLGKRIAFTSRGEIWVMYADGTSARQVTVGPEPSRAPAWSPAADALVFATGYAGDRDLFAVGADGNGLPPLAAGRPDGDAAARSPRKAGARVRQ